MGSGARWQLMEQPQDLGHIDTVSPCLTVLEDAMNISQGGDRDMVPALHVHACTYMYMYIPQNARLCLLCNSTEDEWHILSLCPRYVDIRNHYIDSDLHTFNITFQQ